MYEHGEPWWNDIDGKLLSRPPELSGNPNSRANQELGEGNNIFGITKHLCSYFEGMCHAAILTDKSQMLLKNIKYFQSGQVTF
jgi:hypothetical protein